ncbi:MAG: hypothetical protein QNJ62_06735 [Methyloceanibacter sp.]|nr:hypothetical protein [Methyloceanibacter sp.]
MAHHSPYPGLDPATAKIAEMEQKDRDKMRRLLNEHMRSSIGATGKFPESKLAAHDEGEIAFAVGVTNGKVVIEFGKEVASLGMNPEQAIELASTLPPLAWPKPDFSKFWILTSPKSTKEPQTVVKVAVEWPASTTTR